MMADQKENPTQEKQVFSAQTLYKTTGQYLHKREQFAQASHAYDQAYKSAPENVDVLVGRSHLCVDTFQPQQALKSANEALAIDPHNLGALRAQARANYTMLEFEKSVVACHRGLRKRRKPSYFKLGISQGLDCINNTIGLNAGDIMKHYLPVIKRHAAEIPDRQEPEKLNNPTRKSRIPQPELKIHKTHHEIYQQNLTTRVLAYQYLGPMAYDNFFLQNLIEDPRLNSANKISSQKLKDLAVDTLKALNERQDMLHAQCHYYALKRQGTESQHQNKYKRQLLEQERLTNQKHADKFYFQLEDLKRSLRLNELLKKAQLMQAFLDSKTTYTFPEKETFVDFLYRIVGEGYFSQNRLSYGHSDNHNRLRVAFLMGLHSGRPKSHDSVIAHFPRQYVDPRIALQTASKALETVENGNMKCWLHYEMAQLHTTLKNYPMAKFCAKNCQREAQEIESHIWWLNGCFALISSDVQQGNVNSVENLASEAYQWSKKLGKSEEIQRFLLICSDLANEMAVCDTSGDVEKRKKDILAVMDKRSRLETSLLFNRMATVPEGRRFDMLPQRHDPLKSMQATRCKYKQAHMTVVPGPDKALNRVSFPPVSGLQIKD